MEGRSLVGYSPWGRKESDTTERLHFTTLQYCIDFFHTSENSYVPSLRKLPPSPSHPLGCHGAQDLSQFPLAIYFTYSNIYVSVLLSWFVPPSSPTMSTNLFFMSVSDFPFESSERAQLCQHLNFGVLASGTEKEQISVVVSPQVCGKLSPQP